MITIATEGMGAIPSPFLLGIGLVSAFSEGAGVLVLTLGYSYGRFLTHAPISRNLFH